MNFIPTNNDLSYYPLLHKALEETKGNVLEYGTGHGSTQLLHDYCKSKKRLLASFDEKNEWLSKFTNLTSKYHILRLADNWDNIVSAYPDADVIFIDHAPGERRKFDIYNYRNTKGIIVAHDTEPAADHGYQMRQHFKLFKYVVEVKTNGAWASAMSNEYDLTKWNGEKYGNYTISCM